jgi:DNA-binding MarR family transcriptional regulator
MVRSGANLALLLLGGFRELADRATAELAERGFPDVRPMHDFALRAIDGGADNASELGRRLAVSKQAAAKTIALLEQRRYVEREPDEADRRRVRLRVTDRGHAVMAEGEAIFDELRAQWASEVGAERLEELEAALRHLVGSSTVRPEAPGWLAGELE